MCSREHTFSVCDSDALAVGKLHAVVMTSTDGARSHSWDLSDSELVALYHVVGARVNDARYRAEVASGQIREMSYVDVPEAHPFQVQADVTERPIAP
jgi:hypothetical protein